MITEDYVSFETAKLLKEKGFDEPCLMCYTSDKKIENYGHYNSYKNSEVFALTAPTLQMAMKWLRKEHHFNIIVNCYTDHAEALIMTIEDLPACKCRGIIGEKYEEACEAGIKYCLENLI